MRLKDAQKWAQKPKSRTETVVPSKSGHTKTLTHNIAHKHISLTS